MTHSYMWNGCFVSVSCLILCKNTKRREPANRCHPILHPSDPCPQIFFGFRLDTFTRVCADACLCTYVYVRTVRCSVLQSVCLAHEYNPFCIRTAQFTLLLLTTHSCLPQAQKQDPLSDAYPLGCCSALRWVAVSCGVLRWVAVSCSVLRWDAVHCSVLQWVAVNCSVMRWVAVRCSVLGWVAVSCSVLGWVAVTCSDYDELQCVVVCCDELQWIAVCYYELQWAAVCYDESQWAAVCCDDLQ